MQARFHDGLTARPHTTTVALIDGALAFTVDGRERFWPLAAIDADVEGDTARLSVRSERDARLVMAAADWRDALGPAQAERTRRGRRKEVLLVGGLVAFAAATAQFVFVGVPILSGPLAQATPPSWERRLGRSFELQMASVFPACSGREGQALIEGLGDRLASGATTPFDIRVRAVQAPMTNALALPGGAVMVTDDLIREAKSPDELSAVIAHEVAHVERRHVMQGVWRSLGIGMILDTVVGGGSGAGQQVVLQAGSLTNLRYGREAEYEADRRGQALLHARGLSSRGMAPFFRSIGKTQGRDGAPEAAEFFDTHPDTRRRAAAAQRTERPGAAALTAQEWATVRSACQTEDTGVLADVRRRIDPR